MNSDQLTEVIKKAVRNCIKITPKEGNKETHHQYSELYQHKDNKKGH